MRAKMKVVESHIFLPHLKNWTANALDFKCDKQIAAELKHEKIDDRNIEVLGIERIQRQHLKRNLAQTCIPNYR